MNPFDQAPLIAILLTAVFAQALFLELGFRYGRKKQRKGAKAQLAQVRAIMGASLGLLAFMLAFSFSMAQQHFEERTRTYMLDVSAIGSAYRGADLLEEEVRTTAQDLLKQFAALRLQTSEAARRSDFQRVAQLIRESGRLQDLLWAQARTATADPDHGDAAALFVQSVLAMINAQDARLQAGLFNRISPVIWCTLLLIALLAMVVVGYQAGLTGTRSSLATLSLAITFAIVITLVTDLDRPNTTMFRMNQALMVELENRMGGAQPGAEILPP